MDLIKNTWYRITDMDGKKCRMQYVSKKDLALPGVSAVTYCFTAWAEILIISEGCIAKVETYKTISPDQQARDLGKIEEYHKYMRVNGKKVRTKYIYSMVFDKTKQNEEK